MRIPWKGLRPCLVVLLVLFCFSIQVGNCQDDDEEAPAPPKDQGLCNGIFLTYTFSSREKIYPLVKNATAQAWKFSSQVMILNSGTEELKSWKVFIGFQHDEILVSLDGAQVVDADDYPVRVGKNGTTIAGYPNTDLKTAIETAADFTQMQSTVEITGTQFGMKKGTPMPKTIRLVNDGFKCPAPKKQSNMLSVCCHKDPKFKKKAPKTKFSPRRYGDLSLTYDVLQAYEGYYQAQVTMDNFHPLGRLDHWNLTWEWMRGEFIYSMRGAYTHKKDSTDCIYGPQGQYYKSFDFTPVVNCERKPIISDLPAEKENDEKVGKLPYCCRNGSLLPPIMNETQSRAIFQLQVQKMPPDLNRTAFYPPQRWKINGVLNPEYKCGPPVRIDPTEFPDPSGLAAKSYAVASWQVTCNITKPKPKQARCCVSFSAYYSDSAVPCPTCACGCDDDLVSDQKCDANATALPLPPESLLVPFANRTTKIKAWAAIKHKTLPKKLPCPDSCGLSINWHVDSDYKTGWAARITLFNWQADSFKDWFAAINIKKAYAGYENIYSFNGTKLPGLNNTLFFQGLKGLEQLNGIVNGSNPASDPPVPGKQQSVISFLKKHTPGINVAMGDGFPTKVLFNGEECALPTEFPKRSGAARRSSGGGFVAAVVVGIVSFVLVTGRLG